MSHTELEAMLQASSGMELAAKYRASSWTELEAAELWVKEAGGNDPENVAEGGEDWITRRGEVVVAKEDKYHNI